MGNINWQIMPDDVVHIGSGGARVVIYVGHEFVMLGPPIGGKRCRHFVAINRLFAGGPDRSVDTTTPPGAIQTSTGWRTR